MTMAVSLYILSPQGQGGKGAWTVQAAASLLQSVLAVPVDIQQGEHGCACAWEDSTAWQDRACAEVLPPKLMPVLGWKWVFFCAEWKFWASFTLSSLIWEKHTFSLGINAWLSFGVVCGDEFSLYYPST